MFQKTIKTLTFQTEGDWADTTTVEQVESLTEEYPYTFVVQDHAGGPKVQLILNHEEISQLIQFFRKASPEIKRNE